MLARCFLPLFTLLISACGVAGEKGNAFFHVGSDWAPERPIAIGSSFAASAKAKIGNTQLTVRSATPAVIAGPLPGGNLRAVGEGKAQLEAVNPSTQAVVDTLHYDVSTPATANLAIWYASWVQTSGKLDEKFAVVQGGRYQVGAQLIDKQGHTLHHSGIATLTSDRGQVEPQALGEWFDATPTVLGPGTATLMVKDAADKPAITHVYQLTVIEAKDIATMELVSATTSVIVPPVKDGKAETPKGDADPEAAKPAAATDSWTVVAVVAKMPDGTPVYGPPTVWSESSPGHLLSKQSNGGNWVNVKKGATVTVTATVGTLTKSLEIKGP